MLRKYQYLPAFAFVLCFIVSVFSVSSQSLCAQEQQGRDILEFLGVLTEEQVQQLPMEENTFLIALKRKPSKTFDDNLPKYYYLLLKDVAPMEKQILNDAADGRWDRFDLLRASLIAEGVYDVQKIKAYEARLNQLSAQAREKAKKDSLTKEDYTKFVFESLHNEILTSAYNIEHSNPAISFEKGSYNCVSATILFNALAHKSGLHVCGLEMAGHVSSRVKYGESEISDIETTCATWYLLNNPAERLIAARKHVPAPANANAKRQAVAKPLANANRAKADEGAGKKIREISDVQLVAAIYYNQGHDQWLGNRLPESAVATAKALYLDPENENAWGNLIGAINNIALEFSMKQKRHDIAAGLMDQIALLDPDFKDLHSNQFHIYATWIKELIAANQANDAKTVFQYASERLPNESRMTQLENLVNSATRNR